MGFDNKKFFEILLKGAKGLKMISLSNVAALLDQKAAPILIMNEDETVQDMIAKTLRKENYHVLIASHPEDAFEVMKSHTISVLIASTIEFLNQAKEQFPLVERVLIGQDSLAVDPFKTQEFISVVNDRFKFFQLRYDYARISHQLLNHGMALNAAKNEMARELGLGRQIHKYLLLDEPPRDFPGITLAVASYPSRALDGDFVSFFKPSSRILDFVIGDVMGKGLVSAIVGTVIKGTIAKFAQPYEEHSLVFDHHHFWHENTPSIKEIIRQVHLSTVDQLLKLEYYASIFYGRFDLDKRILTFIDCGFTKPIYFRKASRKAIYIRAGNFPLGTVQKHEYFPFEVHLEMGDMFILYSDGIIEATSPSGELFGEKRLSQIIEYHYTLTPEELAEKVKQAVLLFVEKEVLEDEFTLFIMRVEKFSPVEPSHSGVGKFNSVLNQLEPVRNFTKELCSRSPGNVERLSAELQLAVDEIFTNIVIHGYEKKSGLPVCISRIYQQDEIVIEIADQGHSFNPFEVSPINLFGDQDHGYGWHLVRQIADRVVYTPKKTENGWNRLSIFKKYYTKRINVMEFTPIEQNGILIIRLDSEALDAKQVPEFKEQVLQMLETKGIDYVIFDMHKLLFIDSSGLGAFLSLFRHLNLKGGHLSLAGMTKPVKSIFELVSMQKIFDCHDTLDLAVLAKEKHRK